MLGGAGGQKGPQGDGRLEAGAEASPEGGRSRTEEITAETTRTEARVRRSLREVRLATERAEEVLNQVRDRRQASPGVGTGP